MTSKRAYKLRLAFLRPLQRKGMIVQENAREKMQIMVAGGDGTGARVRQSLIHK